MLSFILSLSMYRIIHIVHIHLSHSLLAACEQHCAAEPSQTETERLQSVGNDVHRQLNITMSSVSAGKNSNASQKGELIYLLLLLLLPLGAYCVVMAESQTVTISSFCWPRIRSLARTDQAPIGANDNERPTTCSAASIHCAHFSPSLT